MKIIIVGGVAGGATAAARLRRLNEKAEIIILERGDYISFANCGLPYYIGDKIKNKDNLTLQTPKSFNSRFNIDVRIMSEAILINAISKTVMVKNLLSGETYEESYDKLVLSPGANPTVPPISGINNKKIFTLRNIPDTYKIKDYAKKLKATKSSPQALVMGGGFIGVEVAENLKNTGINVSIAELSNHIIKTLDFDMAAEVQAYMAEKGVKVYTENPVTNIEEKNNRLTVTLKNEILQCDMIILSIGVTPETNLAKSAGIEVNNRGCIIVNSHMETNVKDIYAVGDAIQITDFILNKASFVPLAGPANKQGRIAADNICGIKSEYTGTQGSSVLKVFDLTVGATGITEETAKENGIDYDKVLLYSASHATYYPNAQMMSIKVIYEKKSGKILGAQIVGFDGVDKRTDVIATAIRLGATGKDLTKLELCYAPPYGSAKDPVNMAGYVIENILNGTVKQYYFEDLQNLPKDGSVTLLDVRTKAEAKIGMIDGFINIPLDELRQRLSELNSKKPIYVHCHSGLRSYLACRILYGNGFDCYNLAGGYRYYKILEENKKTTDFPCYSK